MQPEEDDDKGTNVLWIESTFPCTALSDEDRRVTEAVREEVALTDPYVTVSDPQYKTGCVIYYCSFRSHHTNLTQIQASLAKRLKREVQVWLTIVPIPYLVISVSCNRKPRVVVKPANGTKFCILS